MAILNDANKEVVVRIVFAGAPCAGKTASVRRLGQMLKGQRGNDSVNSPAEAKGRTLYFDWLDYVGGVFKGRRVRCQIISVPGQDVLVERRRLIIHDADAIVFVVDSTPSGVEAAVPYFMEMQPWIDHTDALGEVGIVVQANKHDLPDALRGDQIKKHLGDLSTIRVIETRATDGTGIRECFVSAVGLALARANALFDAGLLKKGEPDLTSSDDLLMQIKARESVVEEPDDTTPSVEQEASDEQRDDASAESLTALMRESITPLAATASAPTERAAATEGNAALALDEETDDANPDAPPLPNGNLRTGTVWPPVAGRIALAELSSHRGKPQQLDDGTWVCVRGRWRLSSPPGSLYDGRAESLKALLEYSRLNRQLAPTLSPHRCVAQALDHSQWRLWEILRTETTLSDALKELLGTQRSAQQSAQALVDIGQTLIDAYVLFAKYPELPRATLDNVGSDDGRPFYASALPDLGFSDPSSPKVRYEKIPLTTFVREQFLPFLHPRYSSHGYVATDLINALEAMPWDDRRGKKTLIDQLILLLIGH